MKLPRGKERLSFGAVRGDGYTILPARYAKGRVLVQAPGIGGWKSPAGCMAEHVGGRYTHREGGYVMSPAAAERMVALLRAGRVASPITGELRA